MEDYILPTIFVQPMKYNDRDASYWKMAKSKQYVERKDVMYQGLCANV